jgi:D-alanine-D-alanine ligase
MRVVVLYNQPVLPEDDPESEAEKWVATAVDNIAGILTVAGHDVVPLGVGRCHSSLANQLAAAAPEVVFNLFEGFADRPASEALVARVLERSGIPFTGSPSQALRRCLDKRVAKQRLTAAGVPTPWWMEIDGRWPVPPELPWPVIVKPACRDASEGIDQESVATCPESLRRRLAAVQQRYGAPVLIEQFLTGREFTVSLIEVPELLALPMGEVIFSELPEVPWPLLTYAAKWMPESADYQVTDMRHAASVEPPLAELVVALAKRAYRALECHDYARIDVRLNEQGQPLVLDVNPNPDMSPTACFAYALKAAGIDRSELFVRLIEQAASRQAKFGDLVGTAP